MLDISSILFAAILSNTIKRRADNFCCFPDRSLDKNAQRYTRREKYSGHVESVVHRTGSIFYEGRYFGHKKANAAQCEYEAVIEAQVLRAEIIGDNGRHEGKLAAELPAGDPDCQEENDDVSGLDDVGQEEKAKDTQGGI